MSLLGLDIGTTGCKAGVFRHDGVILGKGSREYSILTPKTGWAEQDGELVLQKAFECIREAVAAAGEPPTAMAISCQGEAVVPVDEQGRALRPFILGMDLRTGEQNRRLAEQFGADFLFQKTGMPLHTINTLPKLLWLKENEADVWRKADQMLLYEDFFIRRLCGRAVISPCLASRTQMFDLLGGTWMTELLDACGIDPKRLAEIAEPGGEAGVVLPRVADELGLPRGVRVFAGGHDQACAALGAGVIEAGRAMVSTGTAEVVEVVMESPVLAEELRQGGISVYRHVVPGRYVAMTLNHSGGLSLRWFRDVFCQEEMRRAQQEGGDAYDLVLAGAPQGPTDLFVLPHFSGSGTPTLDTASRAAVIGLTYGTQKAELAKAILEGLTFELRINVDLLRRCGISIETLYAVGGGAKNDMWLQLKADICHAEIQRPRVTEAACLGAAISAGVGSGIYSSYNCAAELASVEKRCTPCSPNQELYEQRFQIYSRLYPTLKPLYRMMQGE